MDSFQLASAFNAYVKLCGIGLYHNLESVVVLPNEIVGEVNWSNSPEEDKAVQVFNRNMDTFANLYGRKLSLCGRMSSSSVISRYRPNQLHTPNLIFEVQAPVWLDNVHISQGRADIANKEFTDFLCTGSFDVPPEYRFYNVPERYLGFGDSDAINNCYWKSDHPKGNWTIFKAGEHVQFKTLVDLVHSWEN